MSWVFNPFTGTLDFVAGGKTRLKKDQVVDAGFLTTPEISLDTEPTTDSEVVTLNGLEINSTNYSIAGSTLTMVTTQLKISDKIYINYEG
jgi:hypothetical protein